MKNDDSPITIADLKSNNIIKEILSKTGYAILSEEDSDDKKRLQEHRVWIVDPLDGTTDFVNRTGEFTVMIGLVEEKKPILGIIYWPTENTVFAAQKGCGAWKFSDEIWEKIMVSKTSNLNQCLAVGSRHHLSENEKTLLNKLQITKFTSVGSSLKVAKISSGLADVYLTTTNKMKEWDTCASYCIISEAGGKMTDMFGNDLSYNNQNVIHLNGILATNGLLHNKIVECQKSQ
jgi:3'(2'), 5'-bisphosphate nucleotidase